MPERIHHPTEYAQLGQDRAGDGLAIDAPNFASSFVRGYAEGEIASEAYHRGYTNALEDVDRATQEAAPEPPSSLVIIGALGGAVALGGGLAYAVKSISPPQRPAKIDIVERVKALTDAPNTSARTIGELERDIEQRRLLVRKLEQDAETAEQLAQLKQDQVQAVAQTLKNELEKQESASQWKGHFFSVFYAVLGAVFGVAIDRWLRRRNVLSNQAHSFPANRPRPASRRQ